MDIETIKKYDVVVVPLWIDAGNIASIQVDINGSRVFVATKTWVKLYIPASYFAERVGTTNSIFWIQDGGDGSNGNVTEVRIASVYAENTAQSAPALLDMNTLGAFTGQNVWADSGLNADTNSTDRYYDRSLAPAGMPEDYKRVVKFNAATTADKQWPPIYIRQMTKAQVQDYMAQGYTTVSIWLYVENAEGSSRTNLQIKLLPDGNKYNEQDIATNQWVEVKIALSALVDQMDASTGQVKLLWVTAPASSDNPISAVWMTGLTFENPGRIDIVDFSSDATASFDASTSGDIPNVSASWVTQDNLPGENDKPSNGAVKLTLESGKDANVRVLSTIDKELYRSGYRAKILVYFEKADGGDVTYSMVHWGSVNASQPAAVNTWVTIEVPAYQDGDQNDLYDVNAWFAGGYTGWLKIAADQNVTAVYVAGVWLESPTQA